jgi:hypothetical protein
MTPELAQFSEWVLALLPRLFIYPGGLWLLVGIALIRLAGDGTKGVGPRAWLDDLMGANLPSLAIAWAGVALLPLPGASALPSPVDRWALAAVLGVSLLLDSGMRGAGRGRMAQAGAAITLAILAPLVGGDSLVGLPADYVSRAPLAFGLAVAAVVVGLVMMVWWGGGGLAGQVRGLGWLALALAPVFGDMWPAVTAWVFGAGIIVWLVAGRAKTRPVREQGVLPEGWPLAILWLPAFLALGASLLVVW